MILKTLELAHLPQAEWEIQIEVWENAGDITATQAKSLLKTVDQWTRTGCPLTFGEAAE
jgi:hypothetical protein